MRPELNEKINPEVFIKYYWLKEELYIFCRNNNIPRNGSKKDLTGRIFHYLKTGKIVKSERSKTFKKNSSKAKIQSWSSYRLFR